MQYGLSPATVEKIRETLARFPEIERAVIYGSRAMGNHKSGSDIDLVLFGEDLMPTMLRPIAEALDDLLLPYTMDLSIHSQLRNPDLLDHIARVGITFFQRAPVKVAGR